MTKRNKTANDTRLLEFDETFQMQSNDRQPASGDWLRKPAVGSAEISGRYDAWANTYEHDLVDQWRYTAPRIAADLIVEGGVVDPVLDVGCGTGLVGRYLRTLGVRAIYGIDVSPVSLQLSQAEMAYRELFCADFNAGPLPVGDSAYTALVSVGVLSYATDPAAVIREFARVTKPGGRIVFTHRVDLWDEQLLGDSLLALQRSGVLGRVSWSEPCEYMPGNPDLADLRIRYVTATAP